MTTETTKPPIVGSHEAAAMAGINRNTFNQMRRRGQVPAPQVELRCGPIWKRSVIERWVKGRGK